MSAIDQKSCEMLSLVVLIAAIYAAGPNRSPAPPRFEFHGQDYTTPAYAEKKQVKKEALSLRPIYTISHLSSFKVD